MARRGIAAAAVAIGAAVPGVAVAAPGWTPYPGQPPAEIDGYASLDRVGIDRDGTARVHASIDDPANDETPLRPVVVMRSPGGEWSGPLPGAAPAELGPAIRPRVVEGRIVVALRRPGGSYGPGVAVAPAGPQPPAGASPRAAVSENGDAVVAWIRRPAGGPERLVAATKLGGRPWSTTRILDTGEIGDVAVAVDVRGTALVMWAEGREGGPAVSRRIRVAERTLGRSGWATPRTIGRGHGHGLGLAVDGEGTAHAFWGRSLGRPALTARRNPGSGWRPSGAVPQSCCQVLPRVSLLGEAFVLDPYSGSVGLWHRPAGTARWTAMPDEIPPLDGAGGIRLDLEINAAGDALLGWSTGESNTRMPLRAAYYEAPARPALTSFAARRAGRRVVLDATLSAPGRVLVQVRRAGSPRILDGFIATVRGRRATIAVPARVRTILGRPGRYDLRADTGGRDEAASARTAVLTTR